ncbi:alpha-ketoacid dehydrogenase subunit beta [Yinghuangia aomiensis]|uniref:Alpha-ketoacid dehydrogenase subunit beta n=1 Tax=Yinghuangia aomiensis TaxID=676205 RepID=A0ABP9IDN2_9ACTN
MPDTATIAEPTTLSYAMAVNAALRRALAERGDTILFGEDVALPGGVHGVTRRLRTEFGERVFDTPISESAILGGAIGAALMGRRPIVEIMWADFTFVAFDQLINQAANVRYVSQGRLHAPLTVRTQQGATPGSCAQHSQSVEALFAHIPGLRVCLPATPQDAYDLTLAAIGCDDPVIVIESRALYHSMKGPVTFGTEWPTIGGARTARPGTDITVVTWGATLHTALAAAEALHEEGLEAEVVDLRWLNPLDDRTVLESVARTGRLAVVHDANLTGGFGAEITSRVAENGIPLLAPPVRVGTNDLRIPAAPSLQGAAIPNAATVAERLMKACTAGSLS